MLQWKPVHPGKYSLEWCLIVVQLCKGCVLEILPLYAGFLSIVDTKETKRLTRYLEWPERLWRGQEGSSLALRFRRRFVQLKNARLNQFLRKDFLRSKRSECNAGGFFLQSLLPEPNVGKVLKILTRHWRRVPKISVT